MIHKIAISLISFALVSCAISQQKINDLPHDLEETSGLQWLPSGHLASINDSGNPEEIFIIDTTGQLVKKIKVNHAQNNDWEALSMDSQGQLYIGNFGNNNNDRQDLEIIVIPRGFDSGTETTPVYNIQFSYEDQPSFPPKEGQWRFDCEAFIVKGEWIYLFTKSRVEPFDGKSYIYRIPNKKGQHIAQKIGYLQMKPNKMIHYWVTDAAYHSETHTLAVLTTKKVYFYTLPESTIEKGSQCQLKHSQQLGFIKQREAITFNKDGNELYLTDEKHRLLGGGNLSKIKIEQP